MGGTMSFASRMGWVAIAAAAPCGCASSSRVERAAEGHDRAAIAAEARGDYATAASEREAALKQREKAARRAQLEQQSPITPPLLK